MSQSSKWYFIASLCTLLSVVLCLRFAMLGLILASAISLALCYFCPDSFLYRKAPTRVSKVSGKEFYTPIFTANTLMTLAVLVLPLISLGVIYSDQETTRIFLNWTSLGVINEDVKLSLAYILNDVELPTTSNSDSLKKLKIMGEYRKDISLYLIVNRLSLYFFLPIFIIATAFDRTRSERNSYEFNKKFQHSFLNSMLFALALFALFLGLNHICSAPYLLISTPGNLHIKQTLGIAILPFFMPIIWIIILSIFSKILARPRTLVLGVNSYACR